MIKAEIEQILAELGIPDHIKAHAYLKEMILTAVHDPSAAIPYERLAKGDNVTKQFVHGAIRHAIDTYLKRNKGITVENLVETIGHRLHLKYYTRPVSENESK